MMFPVGRDSRRAVIRLRIADCGLRIGLMMFPVGRDSRRSVIITHPRKESQSTLFREKSKVRGMIVKGMGKSIFRFTVLSAFSL